MTSAIMILTLAWTLSGVVGKEYLNIGGYVGNVVSDNASVAIMLPALFFLVAIGLAFATGTSWGTFGILIPIVLAVVNNDQNLMVMTVAAVLAGSVGGDHISPISDTTILASAGAQCRRVSRGWVHWKWSGRRRGGACHDACDPVLFPEIPLKWINEKSSLRKK